MYSKTLFKHVWFGNLSLYWSSVQELQYASFSYSHKLATLSTGNWIMTPNTPIANQLAESKSISQLKHWRALRKWLSQLYMSTGNALVPTYLAFQERVRFYDLICLPDNCNNYTALVKPVHPFLVMADFSWDCSADRVGGGRDIYCRKWRRSRARCYVSNLRQIWWILDRFW